jgi:pimeloyl-ACP methyl ester carboxylesterase
VTVAGRLFAVAASAIVAVGASPANDPVREIAVRGATLHYVESGRGSPVVFVHGGLADYREWLPVAERLSAAGGFRTIAYSRRYNFPNHNRRPAPPSFSARDEARDLAGLIERLRLGPADVVGASYGAETALLLGLERPGLVRRLVLVEPPLLDWLARIPGGSDALAQFHRDFWKPLSNALAAGDRDAAFAAAVQYFAGSGALESLPPEAREAALANMPEWEELVRSRDPFPAVSRSRVQRLLRPVLLISGGRSYPVARLVDPELAKVLPRARRVVVPDGAHDVCSELPDACADAIREFLRD